NADDLGWTDGVNRGIVEAFHHGIVTSASLLANGAAFALGVAAARSAPGLGIGVHLNLSDGSPVADRKTVRSLLNGDGEFAGSLELTRGSCFRHKAECRCDFETGHPGARTKTACAGCARASPARGNFHGRLFLRNRANRQADTRRR